MKNVFIISGPAGSGKDSVIDGLREKLPLVRIVTTTTRPARAGEHEGSPYYFLSRAEFESRVKAGEFAEYSINENNELYGVTHAELERVEKTEKVAVWRVDWKGVVAIKKLYPDILAILITAPLDVLEARLRKRDDGKDEQYFIDRMKYTEEWMKHLDIYDYEIQNEEGKLDQAIQAVQRIIEERLSR